MPKQILRLTESDLHNLIRKSVNEILQMKKKNVIREDVLGDDWNVNPDEEEVNNNYEPFNDQLDNEEESNDFGITGEKQFDPTDYN